MLFYQCKDTGGLFLTESAAECCAEHLELLVPNTSDGAKEKHVPVIAAHGNSITVTVSSAEHPMLPAHYITCIVLETTSGFQKKDLRPGDRPVAEFLLAAGEYAVAAYEYCNLHGLWKAEA